VLGGNGMTAPAGMLGFRGATIGAGPLPTRVGWEATAPEVEPELPMGGDVGPSPLSLTGATGPEAVAVGVANMADAVVVGETGCGVEPGDTGCVGGGVRVAGVPAPTVGVLFDGTDVFVGAIGVLVDETDVLVGVLVAGTRVLVGVLVAGTRVFVGVLVAGTRVFVGVLVAGTGVLVGVFVAGGCVVGPATEMLPPVTTTPVIVGPPPLFDP